MILPERVLGSPGAHWMMSGLAIAPISAAHSATSSARNCSVGSTPCIGRDVGVDALALDVVGEADHGGLGNLLVQHQRALDFGRAHAVAGDIEHVVHAPGDPVVAVLVATGAVTGEVVARVRLK